MKKILVCDADGTLVNTAEYWLPILDETVRQIELKWGHAPHQENIQAALNFLGQKTEFIYEKFFPGLSEENYKDIVSFADEVWRELINEYPVQYYPDVLATLNAVKEKGFEIFMSSNCGLFYRDQILDAGIRDLISGVACAGSHPGLSKPEFTMSLLKDIGSFEGFFVGDSESDMQAGRANKLKTIFCDYGYASCDDENLIDYRVNAFGEILEIIV